MSAIARRVIVEKIATKIWDHRAKKVHAGMVEHAKKIASETTNVSAQVTSTGDFVRQLSSRIHCARRIRVSTTERVGFRLIAKPTSVNVWMASLAIDVKLT
jgi:hypothetical protein